MSELKYGEKEVLEFDVEKDLEVWSNQHKKSYKISITLPEFTCLCPRSGYPDFAKIHLEYIPDELVVELKAIKIYINSFRNRHISHENTANEIYDVLYNKLKPKWMRVIADFEPRGNVHTVIEIDSQKVNDFSKN
ncbi:MAG: 7-cyano-7-deazaguanine reductase [Campylobacterota bacterium]|nr:7-cyano-7-deazaguanine reductase [Campylobacterota bacterium]